MTDEKTEVKQEKTTGEPVTLKKDHRHAGKDRKAGDTIHVTPSQKKWLQDHKVI